MTTAFRCTLLGAGVFLVVVGLALGLAWEGLLDVVREGFVEDGEAFTASDLDKRARAAALVYGVAGAVASAVYVTFAALALGGRNWARALLIVLVSIGGVISVGALLGSYGGLLGTLLRVALLSLAGTAVVVVTLMLGREANRYFARPVR